MLVWHITAYWQFATYNVTEGSHQENSDFSLKFFFNSGTVFRTFYTNHPQAYSAFSC